MRLRKLLAAIPLSWLTVASFGGSASRASDLVILPDPIQLGPPGTTQRLLVGVGQGGSWVGDRTDEAVVESSDPSVVVIEPGGVARAIADGEAILTARVGEREARARVIVRGAGQPTGWSFRNHIQPVFFRNGCSSGACHGAQAGKNGFKLSLRSYDAAWDHKMLTRQANGRRVSPGRPEDSLILLKPTLQIPHEGGERFAVGSEAYLRLLEWIRAGAPAERPEDPRLAGIELLPEDLTLAVGSEQRMLVRARYDDGSVEDVTAWAKFGVSEDTVAEIDESGRLRVKAAGASAVSAYYMSRVASGRLIAPRAKPVPAEAFARAERRNVIDELVMAQLERLQIPPAGPATDAEFIRRVHLDTIGRLPAPEAVAEFAAEAGPDKRGRLIDRLLASPDFVDYWTYKWSDLLLVSSTHLPRQEELSAFYRFIRQSVAENKPWDRFVHEILTARGSSVVEGAANYFVMHKETIDLVETTSQAFLGMSITCARCHNHPLERWTQDDYYGMANLLARVKLKNGLRGGDTDVLAAEFGDILHPRLGRPVPPRPLDGEPIALADSGDRRQHLAAWLTSPENPYFTRAIVNRVWRNFMGRGLVEPEDDLRLTNPPTNPALMDALAEELIRHGYDLKHLMRLILNSATYQRSSAPADPEAPDRAHYSHYIVRRLSAEVLLDAYAQVTGVPTAFAGYPDGFRALQLRDSRVGSYFLTAFGRPERKQTCSCERTEDANLAQALHVANGETLNAKLRDERSILTRLAQAGDDAAGVEELFTRALARPPTDRERADALAALAGLPREGEAAVRARREALEDLAWALLSGKEFMFNH